MKKPPPRMPDDKRSDTELDTAITCMSKPFDRIRPRPDETVIWLEDWNVPQIGPLFHNGNDTPPDHTEAEI